MIQLFIYAFGCVSASSIDEKEKTGSVNETNVNNTGQENTEGNDSQNTTDTASAGVTDEYVEEVSLTDLTQGLEKNPDCWGSYTSNGYPYCAPGATGYEYRRYDMMNNGISMGSPYSGVAKWILLANDTWDITSDGGDCEVVWTIEGNITTPISCSDCQMGVTSILSINTTTTTCPQDLWSDLETIHETYDVYLDSNGTSVFYNSETQIQYSTGEYNQHAFNSITEGNCNFFVGNESTECSDMPQ